MDFPGPISVNCNLFSHHNYLLGNKACLWIRSALNASAKKKESLEDLSVSLHDNDACTNKNVKDTLVVFA